MIMNLTWINGLLIDWLGLSIIEQESNLTNFDARFVGFEYFDENVFRFHIDILAVADSDRGCGSACPLVTENV